MCVFFFSFLVDQYYIIPFGNSEQSTQVFAVEEQQYYISKEMYNMI